MRCGPAQRGFTYLTALFMIALIGAGLALLGEMWATAAQREKEAELLYVGHQYRRAIEQYVRSGGGLYPRNLQDLIKDPRSISPRRHLRKLYPDPITGSTEWKIVKAPDGGIMGVHSPSEEVPLKVSRFKPRDRDFEGAKKYSDWKFVYAPQQAKPGAPLAPPSAGSPAAPPGPGSPAPPPLPGGGPAPPPFPSGMAAPPPMSPAAAK